MIASQERSSLDQGSSNSERRQLTIMFCEVEGLTTQVGSLDPEDLNELLKPRLVAWNAVIKRFDGYVAKHTGLGLLAYFGYPAGHEDDAERAVHAGLEIVEATRALNGADPKRAAMDISVRVGIATGLVVVGGSIGQGASKEEPAFGMTLNLAARLQSFADPNAILIAPETRHLISSKFECEDLGGREIKGLGDSVNVWRVVGSRATVSRFSASRTCARPSSPGSRPCRIRCCTASARDTMRIPHFGRSSRRSSARLACSAMTVSRRGWTSSNGCCANAAIRRASWRRYSPHCSPCRPRSAIPILLPTRASCAGCRSRVWSRACSRCRIAARWFSCSRTRSGAIRARRNS